MGPRPRATRLGLDVSGLEPIAIFSQIYLRRVVTKTLSSHKLNRSVYNNPCRMQLPAELYYLCILSMCFIVLIFDDICACVSIYLFILLFSLFI